MRITDHYVFFWRGTFSNWAPAKFIDPVSGIEFSNTEQAFMWWKADFFRDFGTRDRIATLSDPAAAKQAGRLVAGYNDVAWTLMRSSYMLYVNYLKYSQNPEMREELLATGRRTLVEASPYDKVWGIGLGEDDPGVTHEGNWKGSNLLGIVLENVRMTIEREGKK